MFNSATVIRLLVILFVCVFFFFRCGKYDIFEIKPTYSDTLLLELNSQEDIQKYLNGIYLLMSDEHYLGGNLWMIADVLSGDVIPPQDDADWIEIQNASASSQNKLSSELWKAIYQTIDRANYVLQRLIDVPIEETIKKQMMCEALTIRAIGHFYLVNLFGLPYDKEKKGNNNQMGVPINLQSSFSVNAAKRQISRSPVEKVYTQIIDDLTKAISVSESKNLTTLYFHQYIAKAYLAKAYFQQNNFDSALLYTSSIINSNRYELFHNLEQKYHHPENKQEILFEILLPENVQPDFGILQYNLWNCSSNNFRVAKRLRNLFNNEEDKRTLVFIHPQYCDADTLFYIKKHSFTKNSIPILQYNEIIWIYLKCLIQTSTSTNEIYQYINTLNERWYGIQNTTLTPENTQSEILKAFAFQGCNLFEKKRIKSDEINNHSWDDAALLLEIPSEELESNPKTVPNN